MKLSHDTRRPLFVFGLLVVLHLFTAAEAAPFTNLVVFGDSLSDVGNIAQAPLINTPGPYYWNGRFSNGAVYAESLATGLGLPALSRSTGGGGDFAYGGAKTTGTGFPDNLLVQDIDDQVDKFLSSRTANASTLYVVFAGANDLIGGQTNMNVPINSLSASMGRLVTAGARQFLVLNLPPLGYTPRYNGSTSTRDQYNTRSQQYNATLATMLNGLASGNPALTIHQLDVASMFTLLLANPAAFGLSNVNQSAAPGLSPGDTSYNTNQLVPNPNQYVFWDDLHPTAAVHAILAQRALDLFRLPGDFNHDDVVNAGDYVMWRKGNGSSYIPYDYEILRSHFGSLTAGGGGAGDGSVAGSAVPEPAAISVLIVGVVACLLVRATNKLNRQAAKYAK